MTACSLLIVDDDDAFRERTAKAFIKRNYDVHIARNGTEALACLRTHEPERALVDLRLGGEWGLQVVKELLAIDPYTQIVVLTAYGSIATALEAIRLGAIGFLQKPATVDEIELAFTKAQQPESQKTAPAPTQVPTLARAEWEHINRVLTECGGNIRQAARLLGLHRRTLQRKLAKYPVKK